MMRANHCIEIFTTNYDLVIETAIDQHNKENQNEIQLGHCWKGNRQKILNIDEWQNKELFTFGNVILTKLHGSIDWKWRDDEVLQSDIMYAGNHERHPILYPGFKGAPSKPIFQAFHSHLSRSLSAADHIIFIGFAFRDSYINDLLDRSITNNTPILVIDPNENLAFDPLPNHATHIKRGFDNKAIYEAFSTMM